MNDPMADPETRQQYAENIERIIQETIAQDRANRQVVRRDTPPVLIGAMGMPNGINQAI